MLVCLFGHIHFTCSQDCFKSSSSQPCSHLFILQLSEYYICSPPGDKDLQNYQCFIASPFILKKQPHVLIFVDNKALVMCIANFLDSLLPPPFQKESVVLHYHSAMCLKNTSSDLMRLLQHQLVCTES